MQHLSTAFERPRRDCVEILLIHTMLRYLASRLELARSKSNCCAHCGVKLLFYKSIRVSLRFPPWQPHSPDIKLTLHIDLQISIANIYRNAPFYFNIILLPHRHCFIKSTEEEHGYRSWKPAAEPPKRLLCQSMDSNNSHWYDMLLLPRGKSPA